VFLSFHPSERKNGRKKKWKDDILFIPTSLDILLDGTDCLGDSFPDSRLDKVDLSLD
jgi:hypothetical protein